MALLVLAWALGQAAGWWTPAWLQRGELMLSDARLRASMPRTHEERVVIIDLDERSLEELGHWP